MVVQGEVALGDCTLRVDVRGFGSFEHRQWPKKGLKVYVTVVDGGLWNLEPLMVADFLKLTLREAVFPLPLWLVGVWHYKAVSQWL